MAHLLQIDSSPRSARSHSRRMTQAFVDQWKRAHPNDTVTYRDLGHDPVPHVDEPWIAAAFTPPDLRTPELWEAIRISDQLVDEFLAADLYVLGTPMYNFSVSSTLKAYIDQIVRPGRTFAVNPDNTTNPYEPLVLGKTMVVISARGASGFGPGGQYEQMNYQTPYLATVFGFMGITNITFIDVENDESGGKTLEEAIARAHTQITQFVMQSSYTVIA